MLGGSEEGRVGEGDESSFSQKLSESMAARKKNFLRQGDRQANNAPRPDPASAVRTAESDRAACCETDIGVRDASGDGADRTLGLLEHDRAGPPTEPNNFRAPTGKPAAKSSS